MKANGVIAVLVALCLSVQCTGCSWLLMDRAPEDYIQHYDFECSGYGAPIADTIIGSLFLTLGFSFATYAFGASDECQAKPGEFGCMSPRSSAITAAIVLIPFGVIYGISAMFHLRATFRRLKEKNSCSKSRKANEKNSGNDVKV